MEKAREAAEADVRGKEAVFLTRRRSQGGGLHCTCTCFHNDMHTAAVLE